MKHLHCKVFGHDYKVSRKVTFHVKEYTCKTCKKQLTTNSNGHLIELSPKFKEINDVLERVYHKRHKKSSDKKINNNLLVFKH
jgi:Na+/phosphate symporter